MTVGEFKVLKEVERSTSLSLSLALLPAPQNTVLSYCFTAMPASMPPHDNLNGLNL